MVNIGVRLQPPDLSALDAWIKLQDDKLSRPRSHPAARWESYRLWRSAAVKLGCPRIGRGDGHMPRDKSSKRLDRKKLDYKKRPYRNELATASFFLNPDREVSGLRHDSLTSEEPSLDLAPPCWL
jgi:hypothetical protein